MKLFYALYPFKTAFLSFLVVRSKYLLVLLNFFFNLGCAYSKRRDITYFYPKKKPFLPENSYPEKIHPVPLTPKKSQLTPFEGTLPISFISFIFSKKKNQGCWDKEGTQYFIFFCA